jgi:hypothetical protein
MPLADFVEGESRRLYDLDTSGQRLRRLAQQRGRCNAEQEKSGWGPRPINQYPENGKEFWSSLHLVNDHQSAEFAQRRFRILEAT